jgi:LmbE family N-acetylglucosaminyl deacetylase
MKDYQDFVAQFTALVRGAKSLPLGGYAPCAKPTLSAHAPRALFFAPHPDDECISGGIALRLLRESGMDVANVAVTQGSKKERQGERLVELQAACDYLGYRLITTGPGGLEKVNVKTRGGDPSHWNAAVETIHKILRENLPGVIVFPHEHDWNSTHIGTHFLVVDALKRMPAGFECYTVESEFWGQMTDPNLMVELSPRDLGDLVTAITFHVGEVNRNPYHLLLPAWMMDNVRRGGELVGGQGGAAPDYSFATLYRLRKWTNGDFVSILPKGRFCPASENLGGLFR